MFDLTTFVALVAGLFVAQLAVVWLTRRADGREGGCPDRLEGGCLRCLHCGAVNEPVYQFCYECVGELQDGAPTVPIQPTSGGSML